MTVDEEIEKERQLINNAIDRIKKSNYKREIDRLYNEIYGSIWIIYAKKVNELLR